MTDWDAVGAIAELVGAVGVVASLIYLASQIRHNSRSVEAATNHAIVRARNELNIAVATRPALSELLRRGASSFDSLQPDESQRYDLCMISNLNIFEDAYVQYSKGLATREFWEENVSVLGLIFSLPGPQQWWRANAHAHVMNPMFRQTIEASIGKQGGRAAEQCGEPEEE